MSTMIRYEEIPAKYHSYPGARFKNNKLIEALPIWRGSKDDLLLDLQHEPPKPDSRTRRLSELIRQGELGTIGDILYGRPAYREAASAIITNLKESYAGRGIASADDLRRRHQIAACTVDQLGPLDRPVELSDVAKFRLGWRQTAPGYGLFGATGTGKTSLLNALMQRLAVVIRHKSTVDGMPSEFVQIPAIRVQVPFDATLRTFCIRFFEQVDFALNQDLYGAQARRHRTVGAMVLQLFKVCSAINLGMLIVDDFQNLRAARGPSVVIALNLFSLLMEISGIGLVIAATPAAGALLETNSRNLRKLTSGGAQLLGMMAQGSAELVEFQDVHAPYQYTRHVASLDDELRRAWHQASGGNPAFASLAFTCAQRHAIGGSESLSRQEFEHAMNYEMALLRPAVRALISQNPADLQAFEDLIFRKELTSLLEAMHINPNGAPADNSELDDEDVPTKRAAFGATACSKGASPAAAKVKREQKGVTGRARTRDASVASGSDRTGIATHERPSATSRSESLPTEDPLSLMRLLH